MDGSVPFVNTGINIHNNHKLMAAIKIMNENLNDSIPSIAYKIGKFWGTPMVFNFFVKQLVEIGFLNPGHITICNNARIYLTEEDSALVDVLRETF